MEAMDLKDRRSPQQGTIPSRLPNRRIVHRIPRGQRIRLREGVYRQIKEREWILDRIDGEGVHLLHETGTYGLIVRMEDIDWGIFKGIVHGRGRNFLYSGGRARN
jgi:hypothetical protein